MVMELTDTKQSKPSVRERANAIKQFRCKNLIAVLESPTDVKNIGTVIRNVNALGVEKVYVVDPSRSLPDDWRIASQTTSFCAVLHLILLIKPSPATSLCLLR